MLNQRIYISIYGKKEGLKLKKTNAARILERSNIPFESLEYTVNEDDLSAEYVAAKMNKPLNQVFKTLVVRGDKSDVIMACIPGSSELNLKSLAALSGNKKVELVHLKEVRSLTGYVRGGVSPIGAKKAYPVYIDESAFQHPYIVISAGARGHQLQLKPEDLAKAVNATSGKITKE